MGHDYLNMEDEDSLLNLYDLSSPDITLFNSVDAELIKLAGSKIFIYKYYKSETHDDVYEEEQTKTISETPVVVFGHYDPKAIEENLTQFGLSQESEQVFTFNSQYVIRKLGRLPIAGDILEPQFQKLKFKVFQVQEDGFESYGIYHTICTAKLLRGSEDIISKDKDIEPKGNIEY